MARENEMELRTERLRRGWSQTKLSALTGIAQSDLSALENGRRPLSPGWRRRIALAFGLPESAFSLRTEERETV